MYLLASVMKRKLQAVYVAHISGRRVHYPPSHTLLPDIEKKSLETCFTKFTVVFIVKLSALYFAHTLHLSWGWGLTFLHSSTEH